MTKVILSGCSGKMGHAIVKAIDERNDCEIACGVDAYDCGDYDFTVYKSFSEITEKYDAIIDFSNPAVLDTMLDYAVTNAVPAVICTTGFSEEQIAEITKYDLYNKMSVQEVIDAVDQVTTTEKFKRAVLNEDLTNFLVTGDNTLTNGLSLPFNKSTSSLSVIAIVSKSFKFKYSLYIKRSMSTLYYTP